MGVPIAIDRYIYAEMATDMASIIGISLDGYGLVYTDSGGNTKVAYADGKVFTVTSQTLYLATGIKYSFTGFNRLERYLSGISGGQYPYYFLPFIRKDNGYLISNWSTVSHYLYAADGTACNNIYSPYYGRSFPISQIVQFDGNNRARRVVHMSYWEPDIYTYYGFNQPWSSPTGSVIVFPALKDNNFYFNGAYFRPMGQNTYPLNMGIQIGDINGSSQAFQPNDGSNNHVGSLPVLLTQSSGITLSGLQNTQYAIKGTANQTEIDESVDLSIFYGLNIGSFGYYDFINDQALPDGLMRDIWATRLGALPYDIPSSNNGIALHGAYYRGFYASAYTPYVPGNAGYTVIGTKSYPSGSGIDPKYLSTTGFYSVYRPDGSVLDFAPSATPVNSPTSNFSEAIISWIGPAGEMFSLHIDQSNPTNVYFAIAGYNYLLRLHGMANWARGVPLSFGAIK